MKKIKILLLVILLMILNHTFSSNLKIISSITIETDVDFDGAKGINVIYKYNFLPLEEENHNDTLLNGSIFKIKTNVYQNNVAVEPAIGYSSVTNTNGNIEFVLTLMGADIDASKFDKKITQFIPYAALKLNQGSNTIQIKAEISGKDATGFLHQQKLEKSDIQFNKPATKVFTMNIDYVELNTLNARGKAWDYSVFRTDAPDVGVNLLVGNTSVWKSHVNDTYMFAVGPNSKNISFTISENDKVAVLIQDIDIMFDDFAAKLLFSTSDKKAGTVYTYNKPKGNIKSCSLNYKID